MLLAARETRTFTTFQISVMALINVLLFTHVQLEQQLHNAWYLNGLLSPKFCQFWLAFDFEDLLLRISRTFTRWYIYRYIYICTTHSDSASQNAIDPDDCQSMSLYLDIQLLPIYTHRLSLACKSTPCEMRINAVQRLLHCDHCLKCEYVSSLAAIQFMSGMTDQLKNSGWTCTMAWILSTSLR